ncbi:MAG TPA: flagellar motor protein MotB [Bryobacteraceae bacterium]|nr:flagellar motor protein MotB [Bryobacteraceae bacterium]
MRRSGPPPHENHERWLVSYADFITLLFAFFVVMFASTQADHTKAREVSESVKEALEHGEFSAAISTVLGRGRHEARRAPLTREPVDARENPPPPPAPASQRPPADLTKSLGSLQQGLASEIKSGKVELKMTARGLIISLREAAFFASGDDTVAPTSYPILGKICQVIDQVPNPLRLEGHTDSIPIHNSRFRSNWELSAARAIATMELLCTRFHLEPERMAIAGYAENAPADTNETEEGRAHNRRVDLVVLSAEGVKDEPPAEPDLPEAPPAKSVPSGHQP